MKKPLDDTLLIESVANEKYSRGLLIAALITSCFMAFFCFVLALSDVGSSPHSLFLEFAFFSLFVAAMLTLLYFTHPCKAFMARAPELCAAYRALHEGYLSSEDVELKMKRMLKGANMYTYSKFLASLEREKEAITEIANALEEKGLIPDMHAIYEFVTDTQIMAELSCRVWCIKHGEDYISQLTHNT